MFGAWDAGAVGGLHSSDAKTVSVGLTGFGHDGLCPATIGAFRFEV